MKNNIKTTKKTTPAAGKSEVTSTTEEVVKKGPGRPKKTELPTNYFRARILTEKELNAKGIGINTEHFKWNPYMNYLLGKVLFVQVRDMTKNGSFKVKNENPKFPYPDRDWTIFPEFYIKEGEPGFELPTPIAESSNTITIEVPEGCVIDTENSTATKLVFKKVEIQEEKSNALPKSWEEVEKISGWRFTTDCKLQSLTLLSCPDIRNTFKTREQAEASIALAQLSILRDIYRQGWVPDWSYDSVDKYCIEFVYKNVDVYPWRDTQFFLTFQSETIANEFLENFRDLIEQARPLMS